MTVRAFFVAPDGRPHAPWRLLLFVLLSLLCAIVVAVTLGQAFASVERFTAIPGTAEAFALTLALLLAHWMAKHLFDHKPFSSVGLDAAAARPRVLAYGWVLGVAPIALPSLLLVAVGWMKIEPSPDGPWLSAALKVSIALIPAAFYEELVSRGYIFATLREWLGPVAAVAITSVAFGLLHLGNPGVTPMSIGMVILAGVFLAVVLIATRSLYAAWMTHVAWNWVMAVPLHVPVSGVEIPRPDYQIVETGPDWITGGAWGPEGGAAAGLGMLCALGYLYWRSRPRGESREPRANNS